MFSSVHLKGDFYIVYVQDKFPVLFPENNEKNTGIRRFLASHLDVVYNNFNTKNTISRMIR